jgi:molecular chaperone GrpE (heat shock protein)
MSGTSSFLLFDLVMTLVAPITTLAIWGSGPSSSAVDSTDVQALRQQCQRLQAQLDAQEEQAIAQVRRETFDTLQSLLTQYPSAAKMVAHQPVFPARHLMALLTPLDQLLAQWGYDRIGDPWDRIDFDPQQHQPDEDDIAPGELVYVRFVGYRQGDRILCPAKVSRTLPSSAD